MKKLILTMIFCLVWSVASAGMNGYLAAVAKKRVATSGGASFTVYQGGYTGNGVDDRDITVTGLASDSDALIFIAHNGAQSGAIRFPDQVGDISSEWADSKAEEANMIQELKTNAFEVGTSYEVNNTNDYTYGVIVNNSSGNVEFGTYAGNSVDGRTISLSTMTGTPDLVIVKSADASFGAFHSIDMGASTDLSGYFTVLGNADNRIQALGTGTFEVSNSSLMNVSGTDYYYAAFIHKSGGFITGTYTGNGVDDRVITGLGFQPDILIIKSEGSPAAVIHTTAMGASTDISYYIYQTSSLSDAIQSLDSDGFEVGTHTTVNLDTVDYYWMAWKTGEHSD